MAEPYSNISEELKPLNTKSTAEMDWKDRKMGSRNSWRGWWWCLCFFMITEMKLRNDMSWGFVMDTKRCT